MTRTAGLISLIILLPIIFVGIFAGVNYKYKFLKDIRAIIGVSTGLVILGIVIGLFAYLGSGSGSGGANPDPQSSQYSLKYDWVGTDLRPESNKGWVYYPNKADPTYGAVEYGAHPELMSDMGGGKLKISVSPNVIETTFGKGRKSIRINTSDLFDDGVFILKADHIPEGVGIWSSWWLNGENATWACHGEIDIIEGAGSIKPRPNDSINSTTLHTNTPPGMQPCMQTGVPGIDNPNCSVGTGNSCGCSGKEQCPDLGCGLRMWENSFGEGFNKNGGGVYACELTKSGLIRVWFFPAGSIPDDIENNNIQPNNWPKQHYLEFKPCPGQFKQMTMIINTTICGAWFGDDDGPCKALLKNPNFDVSNAYWLIDYIKVFQAK